MASHGITSVTLTDGTTSVTLSTLVADRTRFDLRQEVKPPSKTPRGESYFFGLRSEAEVVFLGDSSAADQIETWSQGDTPVTLSASGERSISWDEDTIPGIRPVELRGKIEGRSDGHRLAMRCRTGRDDTHNITIW
jgi:hypothetical protein